MRTKPIKRMGKFASNLREREGSSETRARQPKVPSPKSPLAGAGSTFAYRVKVDPAPYPKRGVGEEAYPPNRLVHQCTYQSEKERKNPTPQGRLRFGKGII